MASVSVPQDLWREKYKCVLLFEGIGVRQILRKKCGTDTLYRMPHIGSKAWTGLKTTVQKTNNQQPALHPCPTSLTCFWAMTTWSEPGRVCFAGACMITARYRPDWATARGRRALWERLAKGTDFPFSQALKFWGHYTQLLYTFLWPAQKSCDSWYVHPVQKCRTEAFHLACCSGDRSSSVFQNSLFRNKLGMCHCPLQ